MRKSTKSNGNRSLLAKALRLIFEAGWGYLDLKADCSPRFAEWALRKNPGPDDSPPGPGGWTPVDLRSGAVAVSLALERIRDPRFRGERLFGASPPLIGAVVDFDGPPSWDRFLADPERAAFAAACLQVGTPRTGAVHLYCLLPAPGALARYQGSRTAGGLGEDADTIVSRPVMKADPRVKVKDERGRTRSAEFPAVSRFYTVGPGSVRAANEKRGKPGGEYRVLHCPDDLPVMPMEIVEHINSRPDEADRDRDGKRRKKKGKKGKGKGADRKGQRTGGRARKTPEEEAAEDAGRGKRWNWGHFNRAAARMAWAGASEEEIVERLTAINDGFNPPTSNARRFEEAAAHQVAHAAKLKAARRGGGVFDAALLADDLYRFYLRRGEAVLPHPNDEAGGYLRFIPSGEAEDLAALDRPGYWKHTEAEIVLDEARDRAQDFRIEQGMERKTSAKITDGLLHSALRFVTRRFAAEVIRSIVPPDEGKARGVPWDRSREVLAFPPGAPVFDFEVGDFRPERYDDLIRYRLGVAPDPDLPTPTYDHFMRTITCDRDDLREDLERIASTAMLQRHRQRMLIWHGERGGNGKGTLNTLFRSILGTLHCTVGGEWRRSGTAFWEARLEGKALVAFDDTLGGPRRFPWDDLKALSGNQTPSAAAKNRPTREWENRATYLFIVNDLPHDLMKRGPIARRLAVFPFDWAAADSPEGEDPHLPGKLQAEAPGVVSRLLDLAERIHRSGDFDPEPARMGPTVRAATDAGWAAIAVVARFLEARLVFASGATARRKTIWEACREWCAGAGERITQAVLYAELAKDGRIRIAPNPDDGKAVTAFGCRVRPADEVDEDGDESADRGVIRCSAPGCRVRATAFIRDGNTERGWCEEHAPPDF